jgi:TATA-binding protein-associated factor Taf7
LRHNNRAAAELDERRAKFLSEAFPGLREDGTVEDEEWESDDENDEDDEDDEEDEEGEENEGDDATEGDEEDVRMVSRSAL